MLLGTIASTRKIMNLTYIITPLLAWFIAGILKFVLNSIRSKQFAINLIGYGGMPSNHSAIVASTVVQIGINEGVAHPAFGVAITLAFIVMLDASSLRHQVGKHAVAINKMAIGMSSHEILRERMGHTRLEIAVGIAVGALIAFLVNTLLDE
jgi:hypothetical protein